ncbi:MAG: peptidoglycan editing factor PgeF, partial [Steroidobacteraceae bacterium]
MTLSWLAIDWPAPPGVRVLSSFRGGGASAPPYASLNLGDHVGDDPEAVADNRRRLQAAAGLPAEPAWLEQVHGVNVANLDSMGPYGPADAAVTRCFGRVCAILTADCLPVVFASESGEIIAAAHAGWRGLCAGVIGATVQAMGTPPQRLIVWLGPAIGPQHFEVGAEVREAFLKVDPRDSDAFERNARGRFMADLALLARGQLSRLGITRIHGGGECTFARADRYFSHRRDGIT